MSLQNVWDSEDERMARDMVIQPIRMERRKDGMENPRVIVQFRSKDDLEATHEMTGWWIDHIQKQMPGYRVIQSSIRLVLGKGETVSVQLTLRPIGRESKEISLDVIEKMFSKTNGYVRPGS